MLPIKVPTGRLSFFFTLQLISVFIPGVIVLVEILAIIRGQELLADPAKPLGSASDATGWVGVVMALVGASAAYALGLASRQLAWSLMNLRKSKRLVEGVAAPPFHGRYGHSADEVIAGHPALYALLTPTMNRTGQENVRAATAIGPGPGVIDSWLRELSGQGGRRAADPLQAVVVELASSGRLLQLLREDHAPAVGTQRDEAIDRDRPLILRQTVKRIIERDGS